jgi:hypothetical protein
VSGQTISTRVCTLILISIAGCSTTPTIIKKTVVPQPSKARSTTAEFSLSPAVSKTSSVHPTDFEYRLVPKASAIDVVVTARFQCPKVVSVPTSTTAIYSNKYGFGARLVTNILGYSGAILGAASAVNDELTRRGRPRLMPDSTNREVWIDSMLRQRSIAGAAISVVGLGMLGTKRIRERTYSKVLRKTGVEKTVVGLTACIEDPAWKIKGRADEGSLSRGDNTPFVKSSTASWTVPWEAVLSGTTFLGDALDPSFPTIEFEVEVKTAAGASVVFSKQIRSDEIAQLAATSPSTISKLQQLKAAAKEKQRERLAAEKKAESERIAAERKAERERVAAERKAERVKQAQYKTMKSLTKQATKKAWGAILGRLKNPISAKILGVELLHAYPFVSKNGSSQLLLWAFKFETLAQNGFGGHNRLTLEVVVAAERQLSGRKKWSWINCGVDKSGFLSMLRSTQDSDAPQSLVAECQKHANFDGRPYGFRLEHF